MNFNKPVLQVNLFKTNFVTSVELIKLAYGLKTSGSSVIVFCFQKALNFTIRASYSGCYTPGCPGEGNRGYSFTSENNTVSGLHVDESVNVHKSTMSVCVSSVV